MDCKIHVMCYEIKWVIEIAFNFESIIHYRLIKSHRKYTGKHLDKSSSSTQAVSLKASCKTIDVRVT